MTSVRVCVHIENFRIQNNVNLQHSIFLFVSNFSFINTGLSHCKISFLFLNVKLVRNMLTGYWAGSHESVRRDAQSLFNIQFFLVQVHLSREPKHVYCTAPYTIPLQTCLWRYRFRSIYIFDVCRFKAYWGSCLFNNF